MRATSPALAIAQTQSRRTPRAAHGGGKPRHGTRNQTVDSGVSGAHSNMRIGMYTPAETGRQDTLPEWSKGVDSSSTSASCVGSNPTGVTFVHIRSRVPVNESEALSPWWAAAAGANVDYGAYCGGCPPGSARVRGNRMHPRLLERALERGEGRAKRIQRAISGANRQLGLAPHSCTGSSRHLRTLGCRGWATRSGARIGHSACHGDARKTGSADA